MASRVKRHLASAGSYSHLAAEETRIVTSGPVVRCVIYWSLTALLLGWILSSTAIDIQVCFWKAKRPVRVPNRFLHSRVQKVLIPCQDAWQSTPEPSPPIPSTAQIP